MLGASLAVLAPSALAERSSHAATRVTVIERDFAFAPKRITAKAGRIVLSIVNRGSFEHNFKLAGRPASGKLRPGRSRAVTLTLEQGVYAFLCTVPGHSAAGMKGTLVVQ